MSLEGPTPTSGPISIDQAVGLLAENREAPAAAVEAPEPAQTPEPDEEIPASTPDADTGSEAQEPGDDGESEQPEPEAEAQPDTDAPNWWTAEDKAHFASLTPEAKAIIARQEAKREAVVSKAKEDAASARKQADTEAQTYNATLKVIGDWLPTAAETFKSRWDGISDADWLEWSRQDPTNYTAAKAQFDADKKQLENIRTVVAEDQKVQRQNFQKAEFDKLKDLVPELVDPKDGLGRRKELADYIVAQGVAPDVLQDLPASALAMARKAMLYDKGVAKLTAPKSPNPTPQRGNAPISATPSRTSQQRSVEQLTARLNKSGSIADAVALMKAQRKTG